MAVMSGACVYTGQNYGARQYRRIRSGVNRVILWSLLLTAGMVGLVWRFDRQIVAVFIKEGEKSAAAAVARTYVRCITGGMLIMTPMYIIRACVQTIGYSQYPGIAGAFQLLARWFMAVVMPAFLGVTAFYLSDVAAWAVTLPIVSIPFYVILGRLIREQETCRADAPSA